MNIERACDRHPPARGNRGLPLRGHDGLPTLLRGRWPNGGTGGHGLPDRWAPRWWPCACGQRCCRDCLSTHILLPTALQTRRADTTEVIGTALLHKAEGLGVRRITARMGRAESTVRRWLGRADGTHVDWMYRQAVTRPAQLAPDVVGEIRYVGNLLGHTLTVLAATAYWGRRRCGFTDSPWALIGIYTQGRLLSPDTG